MKMTSRQAVAIAVRVMKDISWTYDESRQPEAVPHTISDQIEEVSTQKQHPRFKEYIEKLFPYWDVMFFFPEEDGWGERNIMWVSLMDETGEPFEVGHRQTRFKIVKDSNDRFKKVNF